MENLNVTLNLTVGEVNAVLRGLMELSYKESALLINKIKTIGDAAITAENERQSAAAAVPEAPQSKAA